MCLSNSHRRSPSWPSRALAKPTSSPPHFPHILRLASSTFASTIQHQPKCLPGDCRFTQTVCGIIFSPRSQIQGFMGMC